MKGYESYRKAREEQQEAARTIRIRIALIQTILVGTVGQSYSDKALYEYLVSMVPAFNDIMDIVRSNGLTSNILEQDLDLQSCINDVLNDFPLTPKQKLYIVEIFSGVYDSSWADERYEALMEYLPVQIEEWSAGRTPSEFSRLFLAISQIAIKEDTEKNRPILHSLLKLAERAEVSEEQRETLVNLAYKRLRETELPFLATN